MTAGDDSPSTTHATGGTGDAAHPVAPAPRTSATWPSDDSSGAVMPSSAPSTRPEVRPSPPRVWQHEPPAGWNATDEQGYFYRDHRAEEQRERAEQPVNAFFAGPLREYVLQCPGRPVGVLQAGCLASLSELGVRQLEEGGFNVSATVADDDTPLANAILRETGGAYDDVLTGDLRTLALPSRAFDVVYCARLLERIRNVEVVLDHLVAALKPGGLLMIRMSDRYAASALLDRLLPDPVRKPLWRNRHSGIPGPFPAIYEKVVSEPGICAYALMRGLVIAHHAAERARPGNPTRLSSSVRITCAVISKLTRGRFAADHDELLYVIRKPQDRFARVV
jgi:SAM-dependent methyltransferase